MNAGRNLSFLSALTIAALSAQSSDMPEWQKKAGTNLTFDVASVKPAQQPVTPPFPLDNGNEKTPGGRFIAEFPLSTFISFAYKLELSPEQSQVLGQMPKPVANLRFEIEAKAEGNPTKDEMRVMMQSLLADRFKLAAHYEDREAMVFDLVLAQSGKRGPKLVPHSEGPPCAATYPVPAQPTSWTDVFPADCEVVQRRGTPTGVRTGARNVPMSTVATEIYREGFLAGELDKTVIDKTGLSGAFDYRIEYAPDPGSTAAHLQGNPNAPPPEPQGTFLTAIREQLGLKLVRSKGTIRVLVIDHVELPSQN